MSAAVDVLAVMDRGTGLARTMAGLSADPIAKRNLAEMGAARDAVAELIAANRGLLASAPAHMTHRNAKEREAYKAIRAALAACGVQS